MGMPQDHRSPGPDVIDVFITVDIDNPAAGGTGDERRRAADASVRTDRTVDAAWHVLFRFGKGRRRFIQIQSHDSQLPPSLFNAATRQLPARDR